MTNAPMLLGRAKTGCVTNNRETQCGMMSRISKKNSVAWCRPVLHFGINSMVLDLAKDITHAWVHMRKTNTMHSGTARTRVRSNAFLIPENGGYRCCVSYMFVSFLFFLFRRLFLFTAPVSVRIGMIPFIATCRRLILSAVPSLSPGSVWIGASFATVCTAMWSIRLNFDAKFAQPTAQTSYRGTIIMWHNITK